MLRGLAGVNARSRVIPFPWLLGHPYRTTGAPFTVKSMAFVETQEETKVTEIDVQHIMLDVDEPNIRPEDHERLQTLGVFLKDHPQADVLREGFTDATGSEAYNLHLSRRPFS